MLGLGDIRVSKNTPVLILILVEVHSGPHTRIHKYSPNCFVGEDLVLWVLLRLANFLAHDPKNPFYTRPIF